MGWVLLFFVGGALLAFILGDFLNSGSSMFTGDRTTVAEVGGTKISANVYERNVEERLASFQMNSNGENIPSETQDMLRDEAWEQMIRDLIMEQQYNETGIAVGGEELKDMVSGQNIHPEVARAFTNPQTGEFDPSSILSSIKRLRETEDGNNRWAMFEDKIVKERTFEKYAMLIQKGLYVTTAEAERDIQSGSAKANISYVYKSFSSVSDSSITVTDQEIREYYEAHKHLYKQKEEERSLEYVIFNVDPSAEDTLEARNWISEIKEKLVESTTDSLFVNRHADTPFDDRFYGKGSIAANLDSIFFAADSTGLVVGPYFENGAYKLAKLSEKRMHSDSVKVRQFVLLAKEGDTLATYARADSLMKLIQNGTPFGDVAFNNNDDPSTQADSGNIGWVTEYDQRMTYYGPRFTDTCFANTSKGLILLKTPYGAHVIDVQERTKLVPQVRIAFVDRYLKPSQETYNNVYQQANEFAGKSRTEETFSQNSTKLNKRVAEGLRTGDRNIPGLESARPMVRWAYNSEVGDVSDVMAFGDKFAVALLTEVLEEGYIPIDKRKPELEIAAKKEKKVKQFQEEFKSKMAGINDINALASAMGSEAQKVEGITFSASFVAGLGMEPAVIGHAFGEKQGQLSQPIKGNTGVFVIVVESVTPAPEGQDIATKKKSMRATAQSRAATDVVNALLEKADVQDYRAKFY
ncbi:MAG: SurA N-terminal domain-containing protein [Flavobacteriales bacterium]|nr:SurA N-terminal domain-containing protein [Flavobacteriales bacterium]